MEDSLYVCWGLTFDLYSIKYVYPKFLDQSCACLVEEHLYNLWEVNVLLLRGVIKVVLVFFFGYKKLFSICCDLRFDLCFFTSCWLVLDRMLIILASFDLSHTKKDSMIPLDLFFLSLFFYARNALKIPSILCYQAFTYLFSW